MPDNIEVQVDQNFKKLQFIRLSQKSVIYIDNHRVRTYLCCDCGSIVHSKTDHARWHQNILDMIVKAHEGNLEDLMVTYQPTEVNKIVKERKGIVSLY